MRTLRRRRQYHQRIGEDREGAAEVKFPEPDHVEADLIAELDLRHDVPIALALRKPARTGQLIEKAETHHHSSSRWLAAARADRIACRNCKRQSVLPG
jgi:hypothetical protein